MALDLIATHLRQPKPRLSKVNGQFATAAYHSRRHRRVKRSEGAAVDPRPSVAGRGDSNQAPLSLVRRYVDLRCRSASETLPVHARRLKRNVDSSSAGSNWMTTPAVSRAAPLTPHRRCSTRRRWEAGDRPIDRAARADARRCWCPSSHLRREWRKGPHRLIGDESWPPRTLAGHRRNGRGFPTAVCMRRRGKP